MNSVLPPTPSTKLTLDPVVGTLSLLVIKSLALHVTAQDSAWRKHGDVHATAYAQRNSCRARDLFLLIRFASLQPGFVCLALEVLFHSLGAVAGEELLASGAVGLSVLRRDLFTFNQGWHCSSVEGDQARMQS